MSELTRVCEVMCRCGYCTRGLQVNGRRITTPGCCGNWSVVREYWVLREVLEDALVRSFDPLCPKCGGLADNGMDCCVPPKPFPCSKCVGKF